MAKGWSGSSKHTASRSLSGGSASAPSKRAIANSSGGGKSGDRVSPQYDRKAMAPKGGKRG